MILPKYILNTIRKLESAGYEVFLVGGAVRDYILDIEPKDYDLATNATPDEIKKVFYNYKVIMTNHKFGTVIVLFNDNEVEITTYREESCYEDGRKPKHIKFSKSLEKDLSRRDFTINALAYNPNTGIIDLFEGLKDLKLRKIRAVGDPKVRIKEDNLRIMRAIRFSSQLEFDISGDLRYEIIDKGYLLKNISYDRVRDELFKILLSRKPSIGINKLKEYRILKYIIPELIPTINFNQRNPYHDKNLFEHIICVVDSVEPLLELRLAALFHDIGKPSCFTIDNDGIGHFYGHELESSKIAYEVLKRLNTPNKIIEKTILLIEEHMGHTNELSEKAIRRLIYRVGEDNIFKLLNLQISDLKCTKKNRDIEPILKRKRDVEKIMEKIYVSRDSKLDITGYDIIGLGYQEGPEIGIILKSLKEKVIEDPTFNEKEKLIDYIKRNFE